MWHFISHNRHSPSYESVARERAQTYSSVFRRDNEAGMKHYFCYAMVPSQQYTGQYVCRGMIQACNKVDTDRVFRAACAGELISGYEAMPAYHKVNKFESIGIHCCVVPHLTVCRQTENEKHMIILAADYQAYGVEERRRELTVEQLGKIMVDDLTLEDLARLSRSPFIEISEEHYGQYYASMTTE